MSFSEKFLLTVSFFGLCAIPLGYAQAEDCTGTLPGANCTLDENTTAPLTIGNGNTLTVGASVTVGDAVDGDAADGDGTIQTNSGAITVQQTAAIGSTTSIDDLLIGDGDQWDAYADITTNNDGTDIDLGAADGGEVLNVNSGADITGEIDGHNLDNLNVGADGLGGDFNFVGQAETVSLNVISGTLTTNASWGSGTPLNDVSVSDGASVVLGRGLTSTGAFDLDGSVSINAGETLTVGSFTADADGGEITIGLTKDTGTTTNGVFNITGGGPVDLSNEIVGFNIEQNSEVLTSTVLTDVIRGNGGATIVPTIQDNSFLYDFSFSQSGSNLDLTIDRRSLDSATTTENNKVMAEKFLVNLEAIANTDIKEIQANLSNASSQQEFNDILESTQPSVDASTTRISNFVANKTISMARSRISQLIRSPGGSVNGKYTISSNKPISSENIYASIGYYGSDSENSSDKDDQDGVVRNRTRDLAMRRLRYLKAREEKMNRKSLDDDLRVYKKYDYEDSERGIQVWAQAFGGTGNQDERDGIRSYDFSTTGLSFGADTGNLDDNLVIGGMLTYADSDADASDANSTKTNMQTYQVGMYGAYNFSNDYYVEGAVSYGLNDISVSRSNVGGTGSQAIAEYDGELITLYGEVGKKIDLENNTYLIPGFLTQYTHTSYEDYRERGAGGANLTVQQNTINSLQVGPRVTVSWAKELESGIRYMPYVETAYKYDAIQGKTEAIAVLDGGNSGQVKISGFDPQAHAFDFGTGVTFSEDSWSLNVDYDFEYKEDFNGHAGAVKANYHF